MLIESLLIGLLLDGNIYLATHRANTSPKSVQTYRLSIRFPGRMNEGGTVSRGIGCAQGTTH